MQAARVSKQDYQTSLRLPKAMADYIKRFAEEWDVPSSYVYRQCVKEFINKYSKQGGRNG